MMHFELFYSFSSRMISSALNPKEGTDGRSQSPERHSELLLVHRF